MAALLSPTTAIVDYPAIARSFAADVAAAGGRVLTSHAGHRAAAARARGRTALRRHPAGSFRLSRLVICAGLQADLLAATVGDAAAPEIIPFRGEYLRLRAARGRPGAAAHLPGARPPVPVPRRAPDAPRRRHVRPRAQRGARAGPRGVPAHRREPGTRSRGWPARRPSGGWRRQHWMTGVREYRGSLRAARLPRRGEDLPAVADAGRRDQRARRGAGAGGRPDGGLVDDFRIGQVGPVTSVRNAPSPAATASMAIAEHIVAELKLQLDTRKVAPRVHR